MITLSDFISETKVLRRCVDAAEIIFSYDEHGRAVRLIGFQSDASKTDFEIKEEGYQYYKRLLEEVNKNK